MYSSPASLQMYIKEDNSMCLGMMNYREPKEDLTVIACKKCGRNWQVKETEAKHFNVVNEGLCASCRVKPEKKLSLLKQDETETIKSKICDDICRFAADCSITQEQLDDYCANCIADRIVRIETK